MTIPDTSLMDLASLDIKWLRASACANQLFRQYGAVALTAAFCPPEPPSTEETMMEVLISGEWRLAYPMREGFFVMLRRGMAGTLNLWLSADAIARRLREGTARVTS